MKRRDLLLGGVLAAALAAGVLLTRGLGPGIDGAATALDLTEGNGSFAVDGLEVEVTAGPRPLRVFAPLRFALRFTRDGEVVPVEEARLDFTMTMDMGSHVYRLVPDADTWIAADVVLPQCGSGSRLWFADLDFVAAGEARSSRLRLELHPPRTD